MHGAPVGAGGTIIYFVCDDCAQAVKRAKEAGGHVVKDEFSIGDYGDIALVSIRTAMSSDSTRWPDGGFAQGAVLRAREQWRRDAPPPIRPSRRAAAIRARPPPRRRV